MYIIRHSVQDGYLYNLITRNKKNFKQPSRWSAAGSLIQSFQSPVPVRLRSNKPPHNPEHDQATTRNKHQTHKRMFWNITMGIHESITQRLQDSTELIHVKR